MEETSSDIRRGFTTLALLVALVGASLGAESRWIHLRSSNFEMYTSAGARGARDTMREFEQVRGFFLQAFGKPPANPMPVRLVLFGSQKEYQPYRINDFATAHYQQTADREFIVMSHGGSDTFPVAVHEYVHLLVRHAGLTPPPWLNEGLAELYSTLRPMGPKILVGDLIPWRRQALLQDKWVPLTAILAADQHSPFYNEKNKASSLYNEGWALTHMLFLRNGYRDKFGEVLRRVSANTDSAQVLQDIYGFPIGQIEKDLQAYMRGNSFQGVLVPAKLDKDPNDIPAEELAEFDVRLMFADLVYLPGKEAARQAALEQLIALDAKRPEPYRGLAYLALQRANYDQAVEQFAKAYERGARDSQLLWDYGRLLERKRSKEAVSVLSELLSQDLSRLDVRLELAESQLRENQAKAALATLAAIHTVPPADAQRFFRAAVYAHLSNGDQKNAEVTAKHFREVATSDDDREVADFLVAQASRRSVPVERPPVEGTDQGRPRLRREEAVQEQQISPPPAPPTRPSISGRFVRLDCLGKQARMTIETAAGRKVFLIADAGNITITAGSEGPVEMTCGPQKKPPQIEIGYDPPPANLAGVDGIIRSIAF